MLPGRLGFLIVAAAACSLACWRSQLDDRGPAGGPLTQGDDAAADAAAGADAPAEALVADCDLVSGVGCPAGWRCERRCTPFGTICTPAGAGVNRTLCHAGTDCAVGYHCVSNGQTQGECLHYCLTDADCAPIGRRCGVHATCGDAHVDAEISLCN